MLNLNFTTMMGGILKYYNPLFFIIKKINNILYYHIKNKNI